MSDSLLIEPAIIITEPKPVTTTVFNGILDIEIKGTDAVFTLYEDNRAPLGNVIERKIVARLQTQLNTVPSMIKQVTDAVSDHVIDVVTTVAKSFFPRLH